jgi:hypothetical protein
MGGVKGCGVGEEAAPSPPTPRPGRDVGVGVLEIKIWWHNRSFRSPICQWRSNKELPVHQTWSETNESLVILP